MKQKKYDDDDGRTIADMNIPGIRGHRPNMDPNAPAPVELTNKEKRALLVGAYKAALPYLLTFLGGLTLVAVLLYLWLRAN